MLLFISGFALGWLVFKRPETLERVGTWLKDWVVGKFK